MATTLPTSGPIETSVYPSISYEEFGRLLRKYGYAAEALIDRNRFGYRTLTQPYFGAWMQTPFRGRPDEFASVFLHSHVDLPPVTAAAAVHELNWKMMVAHVTTNRRGRLVASHTIVVCGGYHGVLPARPALVLVPGPRAHPCRGVQADAEVGRVDAALSTRCRTAS